MGPEASATGLKQARVNRLWAAVERTCCEVVWELDPEGTMTYLSDAALSLLGVPADRLVGRSVLSVVHPEDVERARSIVENCVARREGWDKVRLRVRRPDGTTSWVETSGIAHVTGDGRLMGFTATTRRLDSSEVADTRREMIRARIARVLSERALRTVWQPIYAVEDGTLAGVEALTRFSQPGPPGPDQWFADAAEVGLGEELDLLAIRTALGEVGRLPTVPYVSLNVSPSTVGEALRAVIEDAPVPPTKIVLELTEHVSVGDYDTFLPPLDGLRRLGVRVAVDDAGAGFASFRHILRIRPDIIKLDRSLVSGVSEDAGQRALAAALVMFALEAGSMTVVAEGVETEADLDTITLLGVDAVQGFLLSRPVGASEVRPGLRRERRAGARPSTG